MNINKELLKNFKLLYIEDDTTVREELSKLMSDFFAKVYIANDGQEGYEIFLNNSDEIDIILTDINMPNLNGIDLVKKVRKSSSIPVLITTAHSDSDYLSQAIKLKVYEYITKPVDVRELLKILENLASSIYQETLLKQQKKELEEYKRVVDSNNIVVKTDTHMKITYVNDLFCQITGYSTTDLINKEFKSIKHPDMSDDIYKKIYSNILNNEPWHGVLKNLSKSKNTFTTDCHIIPSLDDNGNIIGAISIQRDITDELNKKRDIQLALMRDKSDIFIKSKEGWAEQSVMINSLQKDLDYYKNEVKRLDEKLQRYIFTTEKYTSENKELRSKLSIYKKNEKKHNDLAFLKKQNNELDYKVRKLTQNLEETKTKYKTTISDLKVSHKVQLDELELKLEELTELYETVKSDDVLLQKLNYWKDKAKEETLRIETLEKKVIASGNKEVMSKVFN